MSRGHNDSILVPFKVLSYSYVRFIEGTPFLSMICACCAMPFSRICFIHAARSEPNKSPKSLDMKLLNFLQLMGSAQVVQSAHD